MYASDSVSEIVRCMRIFERFLWAEASNDSAIVDGGNFSRLSCTTSAILWCSVHCTIS